MKRALVIACLLCGLARGQDAGALYAVLASENVDISDGYVTAGLILRYDGIRNTRSGHNASATTWEDLSGGAHDITLRSGVSVSANHLVFTGTGGGRLDWKPATPNGVTLEVVSCATTNLTMGLVGWANMNYADKNRLVKYYNTIAYQCAESNAFKYAYLAGSESIYKTNYFSAARTQVFLNARKLLNTPNFFIGETSYPLTIGETYIHPAGTIYDKLYGKIFAVRVYNRNLSEAECATNYARDRARFGLP